MLRRISPSERWYITGSSGSGKSTFARYVAASLTRRIPLVAIDTKGDFLPASEPVSIRKAIASLKDLKPGDVMRVCPDLGERNKDNFDALFQAIYLRQHTGVVVDEVYQVESDVMDDLLTTGRAREIPIIACTQRPAWHSRFYLSEASRISAFKLTDPADRKRLSGFMDIDTDILLPDHCQYYRNEDGETEYYTACPPTTTIDRAPRTKSEQDEIPTSGGLILWSNGEH